MTYDSSLRPISPPSPRVPWEDRYPKEERGDPLPAGFKVPVVDLAELMGRVLAQSTVDLTDDAACLLELMGGDRDGKGWPCREASGYLREAQRYAVAFRCRGIAA